MQLSIYRDSGQYQVIQVETTVIPRISEKVSMRNLCGNCSDMTVIDIVYL